jgi:hypothetical protein
MSDVTHPLPSSILREVDAFVATVHTNRPRRLDPVGLARTLAIEMSRRDLGETLLGLTLDENRMLLHRKLRGARLAFVFAHELAHIQCRRGAFRGLARSDEEWFADWFARELLLPRRWLLDRDRWPRTQLGSLCVDGETAALQLAALGSGPALMRNGSRVLCRRCGTRTYDWHCHCRAWRTRTDIRELPDLRQLELLYTPPRWRSAWLRFPQWETDMPAVARRPIARAGASPPALA